MASHKQITANRNNSLKSTGPKTPKGKYWSSHNNIKHGLTSKDLIVGEDQKSFESYREAAERENSYIRWVDPFEPVNKNKLGHSQSWRIEKKYEYY